ncbi:MAG: terminase large subunit [Alphaproteobacteria bacterium]|nr:terminase large subunit [Alphaproteobacteria bacterium]
MSTPCTELAGDLGAALDPVAFCQRYLRSQLPQLDEWQEQACRISAKNVQLLCGRQTGKSTLAAMIALWKLTMWPGSLTLLISPTLRQSSELFRKCMAMFDVMTTPPGVVNRSKTEIQTAIGSKVFSLPGANPDTIRGYSAPDLVIEDEAAFVNDRTFAATRPMLATNPNAMHMLLTTPYGRRGHFYDLWRAQHSGWSRFMIKSKDCPRISAEFLAGEQTVLSDRSYRQEYQCEFLESSTAVFPSDLVQRLMDENQRRVIMPDHDELRERRKELREVETIEDLRAYHKRHGIDGDNIISSMNQGPGPWSDV